MEQNIVDFTDIMAGWLNIEIYDPRYEITRKMRVSYIQPFFNDMLMACKFLLSDITGIYEVYLDQEGFEGYFRFYKYKLGYIILEIGEEKFEDELEKIDEDILYEGKEVISYFDIPITEFVENIIFLIDLHKKEYNEGFVFSPVDEFSTDLLEEVKTNLYNKMLGGESDEKASDS